LNAGFLGPDAAHLQMMHRYYRQISANRCIRLCIFSQFHFIARLRQGLAGGASVSYTCDNLNRPSTVVDNNPQGNQTTAYSYDRASVGKPLRSSMQSAIEVQGDRESLNDPGVRRSVTE
jgi:hypothetical protein